MTASVGGHAGTEYLAAIVHQHERHILTHQCESLNDLFQMTELGLVGPQELAPGRGVVEEIAHRDHRAAGQGRRTHLLLLADHLPGQIRAAGARRQGQTRHRGNRRQRLAAKTHAGDALEVFQRSQFAGRVARQCQRKVISVDPGPVVNDADQLDPALFDIDLHPPCTRIQAVFDQLLDHGSRTLHHLAGGDLVDELGRQGMNTGGHVRILPPAGTTKKARANAGQAFLQKKGTVRGGYKTSPAPGARPGEPHRMGPSWPAASARPACRPSVTSWTAYSHRPGS